MRKMTPKVLGPISREEAIKLDESYVKFRELDSMSQDNWAAFDHVQNLQNELKKGQLVLTVDPKSIDRKHPQYLICRVSMVKRNCIQAVDGPVIRVTDGQYSWRVDGNGYCVPAIVKE
jgi:hypothetical protein